VLRQGILAEGEYNMINFLALTNSDPLLFKLKLYLSLFTKQAILTKRSNVLSLPLTEKK
jgi:hypothetical protein